MSERVLALLKAHGWNATCFQVLEPGFRYFFTARSCVAYVDTGGAYVAAGAPIGPDDDLASAADAFRAHARAAGKRACFFAVEERFTTSVPLQAVPIGEMPLWDPRGWPETLAGSRSLREQLRRARARKINVRTLTAAELPAQHARLEALVADWLGTRELAPMGFLVQVHLFDHPEERRVFLAEQDGRAIAFLGAVPIPARKGWLFEDLIRGHGAPNGTTELLVDHAMRAVAAEGAELVTLGLAPLSGQLPRHLRAARAWTSALYDFEGLRAFKARLRPHAWAEVFLACEPGDPGGARAIADSLAAFARRGVLRFGVETLLRGPALVIRALALLLIPWTALVALADPHWFPSLEVKWAWVTFDLLLVAALLSVAARFRNWLAAALTAVIAVDAILTLAQVLFWVLPRARGPLDWAVSAVAVAAPSFAAFSLWRARLHRRARR